MKRGQLKILFMSCIAIVIGLILLFIYKPNQSKNYYTENIEDYNYDNFVFSPIFPEQIPENAHVVSFCKYLYYHVDRDFFLELKFDTVDEMQQYLTAIISKCNNTSLTEEQSVFIESENIYDNAFTDLFYTINHITFSNSRMYTGYENKLYDDGWRYNCHFGIISFSYEDLTVIHAESSGYGYNKDSRHFPRYLERFNVPLDEAHQRIIYLD